MATVYHVKLPPPLDFLASSITGRGRPRLRWGEEGRKGGRERGHSDVAVSERGGECRHREREGHRIGIEWNLSGGRVEDGCPNRIMAYISVDVELERCVLSLETHIMLRKKILPKINM
jgi:hypothetical protein